MAAVVRMVARGCVILAVVGSCSSSGETKQAQFTASGDATVLGRVTGTWQGGDLTLVLCEDTTQSFCSTDYCVRDNSLPCHEIKTNGKDETLSYQNGSNGGCGDCSECACYFVRAGVVLTAHIATSAGATSDYPARAFVADVAGTSNSGIDVVVVDAQQAAEAADGGVNRARPLGKLDVGDGGDELVFRTDDGDGDGGKSQNALSGVTMRKVATTTNPCVK